MYFIQEQPILGHECILADCLGLRPTQCWLTGQTFKVCLYLTAAAFQQEISKPSWAAQATYNAEMCWKVSRVEVSVSEVLVSEKTNDPSVYGEKWFAVKVWQLLYRELSIYMAYYYCKFIVHVHLYTFLYLPVTW